jgi:AAA domain (dynein-related subfamily)
VTIGLTSGEVNLNARDCPKVGTVVSEVMDMPADPESSPFTLQADALAGSEPRVRVRVDRVLDEPLTRETLASDETLSGISISRQRQGTNFPVTAEQDELLQAALAETSVLERYFILQQRADRGYDWDEEGRIYHFTPHASGAWKRLAESPGASFVYYRPGSGGGETRRTYFGYGRISRIDEDTDESGRHFRAHVVDYRPLPRPVPASEYDPRSNVQMSIAEIDAGSFEELLRRGGIRRGTPVPGYAEPPFDEIVRRILGEGIVLTERTIRRYHLSLQTRGFVVLSGVSGTGKTWLAQAYAKAVDAKTLVVPVAPNWTTNEDLLGYQSPLQPVYHDTLFSQFLRDAAAEWEAAEEDGRAAWPYHIILDEMNLARVEYYFAKFLSAMEVRARGESALIELTPSDVVTLGRNLFFVGTVNIDETTHMFADKVFDRAQLVELHVSAEDLARHLEGAAFRNDLLEIWEAVYAVAPFAFRVVDEIQEVRRCSSRAGSRLGGRLRRGAVPEGAAEAEGRRPARRESAAASRRADGVAVSPDAREGAGDARPLRAPWLQLVLLKSATGTGTVPLPRGRRNGRRASLSSPLRRKIGRTLRSRFRELRSPYRFESSATKRSSWRNGHARALAITHSRASCPTDGSRSPGLSVPRS